MTASYFEKGRNPLIASDEDATTHVHTQKVIVTSAPAASVTLTLSEGAGATDSTTLRVVPATDGTVLGAVTETAPATDTASSGLNGRLQRVAQRLTSLIALLPTALGAGGGLKVDGSGTALPVSGTVTANAGTNLNTSALALEAGNLATVVTDLGGVTETAPATDTASSGLNGRLQRVAQRLTSIIALLPTALGAGGGLKVDGSGTALPVSGTVTANAGTNLYTSLLALESGGNLAAMAAVEGTTAGAAVITDANGTIQQYLRGLVKQWIAGTLVLGAGTNKIGTVKTRFFSVVFSTLTRAANATPYSIGDSISDNATPGSVTAIPCTVASDVNDAPICITELLLDTNDTGLAAAVQVRAYIFGADPTASSGVGGGDNLAYSQKKNGFLGSFSGSFRAFSDGGKARLVPDEGSFVIANPSSGGTTVWIQYQTLTAFTPSGNSTTIDARLRGFQGSA